MTGAVGDTTMDVLLISPPLVQINTPYPATQFLLGYLDQIGVKGSQRDLGIELVLTALSRKGLQEIFEKGSRPTRPETQFFFDARNDVLRVIDDVILFLQGKNPTLAFRIAGRTLVPEGGRFASWDASEMPGYFGTLGVQDQAKHIASLFIDDCIDYIQDTFDPWFSLSKSPS